MAKQQKVTKDGGYSRKRKLGLVPYNYDKSSRRYAEGAWKNWEPHLARQLAEANAGRGKFWRAAQ